MNPLAPAELILNPLNLINKLILNSYQPNTCFSQAGGLREDPEEMDGAPEELNFLGNVAVVEVE